MSKLLDKIFEGTDASIQVGASVSSNDKGDIIIDRDGVQYLYDPRTGEEYKISKYKKLMAKMLNSLKRFAPEFEKYINNLIPVFTCKIGTFATGDGYIFMSPAFFDKLIEIYSNSVDDKTDPSFDEFQLVEYVYIHELYHNIFNHMEDGRRYLKEYPDHDYQNMAMDYEINYLIEKTWGLEGMTKLASGLIDDKYAGMIWRTIYPYMQGDPKKINYKHLEQKNNSKQPQPSQPKRRKSDDEILGERDITAALTKIIEKETGGAKDKASMTRALNKVRDYLDSLGIALNESNTLNDPNDTWSRGYNDGVVNKASSIYKTLWDIVNDVDNSGEGEDESERIPEDKKLNDLLPERENKGKGEGKNSEDKSKRNDKSDSENGENSDGEDENGDEKSGENGENSDNGDSNKNKGGDKGDNTDGGNDGTNSGDGSEEGDPQGGNDGTDGGNGKEPGGDGDEDNGDGKEPGGDGNTPDGNDEDGDGTDGTDGTDGGNGKEPGNDGNTQGGDGEDGTDGTDGGNGKISIIDKPLTQTEESLSQEEMGAILNQQPELKKPIEVTASYSDRMSDVVDVTERLTGGSDEKIKNIIGEINRNVHANMHVSPIDWKKELKKFIKKYNPVPDKKHDIFGRAHVDDVIPSLPAERGEKSKMKHVVFGLDISGSTQAQNSLQYLIGETYNILRDCISDGCIVDVMKYDSTVDSGNSIRFIHKKQYLEDELTLIKRCRAGGENDFAPCLRACKKLLEGEYIDEIYAFSKDFPVLDANQILKDEILGSDGRTDISIAKKIASDTNLVYSAGGSKCPKADVCILMTDTDWTYAKKYYDIDRKKVRVMCMVDIGCCPSNFNKATKSLIYDNIQWGSKSENNKYNRIDSTFWPESMIYVEGVGKGIADNNSSESAKEKSFKSKVNEGLLGGFDREGEIEDAVTVDNVKIHNLAGSIIEDSHIELGDLYSAESGGEVINGSMVTIKNDKIFLDVPEGKAIIINKNCYFNENMRILNVNGNICIYGNNLSLKGNDGRLNLPNIVNGLIVFEMSDNIDYDTYDSYEPDGDNRKIYVNCVNKENSKYTFEKFSNENDVLGTQRFYIKYAKKYFAEHLQMEPEYKRSAQAFVSGNFVYRDELDACECTLRVDKSRDEFSITTQALNDNKYYGCDGKLPDFISLKSVSKTISIEDYDGYNLWFNGMPIENSDMFITFANNGTYKRVESAQGDEKHISFDKYKEIIEENGGDYNIIFQGKTMIG